MLLPLDGMALAVQPGGPRRGRNGSGSVAFAQDLPCRLRRAPLPGGTGAPRDANAARYIMPMSSSKTSRCVSSRDS